MSPRVIYMEFLILLLSIFLIFTDTYIIFTNVDQLSNVDMKECSTELPDKLLPIKKIWPIRYTLNLMVEPSYDYVRGYTIISIMIENSTRDISLHADGLGIPHTTIQLTKVHAERCHTAEMSYTFVGHRYCRVSQILDLRFHKNIVPGVYELTIHFLTRFSSTRKGILKYQYNENTTFGQETRLVATQFESNSARRFFPCWDEPGVKAVFNITIIHPKDYIPFSNMPMLHYEDVEVFDKYLGSTHFADTPPISASHVSIALLKSNLIITEDTEFSEVDQVWHRPEVKALKHALTILRYMRTWHYLTNTQILQKRCYILLPHNVLNTGCLGLIINREKDFVYDACFDFPGRKLDITKTIAQKMAREWFLGLVTPAWWTDLWLGESLAKFYGHESLMRKILGDTEIINLYAIKTLQSTLHNDVNLRMKAISAYNVRNADEIDEHLISPFYYDKGFALIQMLGHVLSKEKFEEVMMKYIKTYMLNSATANDFWTILQRAYNEVGHETVVIKEIMDTWLTQRHYTHVQVNKLLSDNKIEIYIRQEDVNRTVRWKIPITYDIIAMGSNFHSYNTVNVWLNHSRHLITINESTDYVIFKTMQSGYYRVNYDIHTWEKIAFNFIIYEHNRIHVLTRARIIDDAYYFMMRGENPPEIFWDIASYLKYETDFIAWYPMFNILSYVGSYWDYPAASYQKGIVLDILNGLLGNLGYVEKTGETEMQEALRLLATRWACKLGFAECRSAANAKLITHLADPDKHKISPWWKDWIFCAGMMAANNHTWMELFRKYVDTKNPDFLKYLYCSEDEQIIKKYLEMFSENILTSESLIHEEFANIIYGIVRKHIRKNAVWKQVLWQYFTRTGLQRDTIDLNITAAVILNTYSDEQLDKIMEVIQYRGSEINMSTVNFLKQAQKQRIERYNEKYQNF